MEAHSHTRTVQSFPVPVPLYLPSIPRACSLAQLLPSNLLQSGRRGGERHREWTVLVAGRPRCVPDHLAANLWLLTPGEQLESLFYWGIGARLEHVRRQPSRPVGGEAWKSHYPESP